MATPYPYKTISDRLLPFRAVDEHDVINLYALTVEGPAGLFVTPTAFDPDNTEGYTDEDVGTSVEGVHSKRYAVANKIAPSSAGDNKYKVLGITLRSTIEHDENGNRLIYNRRKSEEMGVSILGEAVPVATRGIFTLTKDAYVGTPTVGSVGVIDDNGEGKIKVVDPADLNEAGEPTDADVVGKFLSDESSKFGGYAIFKLEL